MSKRIKIWLAVIGVSIALLTFSYAVAAQNNKATVIHPITLERKAVTIGDPAAFSGGFVLETSYGYIPQVPGQLGFSVATRYKTTLSTSMTSVQTTLPVSSLVTQDNHALTMGDLGSKVFLTVEPGGNKEEIIMCTGILSSSWTGCTRGLAFYGTSTASVAANQKTHSAGSVVIMSNVHYVYDEAVDKDAAETIGGNKTYTGTNYFYILPTATTTYGTDANQLITLGQAQALTNQGAATSSDSNAGIAERATKAEIAAGTAFDANNPHYISSEHATSSSDVATTSVVVTQTNGKIAQNFIDLTGTYAWTGPHSYSATSTFTGQISASATSTFTGQVYGAGFTHIAVYTASTTWSKPTGVTKVRVRLVGGGGNGGSMSGVEGAVGGGGGGGYCEKIADVTATTSVQLIVGGIGGTSSFGNFCSATGGSNGAGSAAGGNGGAGGVGSLGDLNLTGQGGGAGMQGYGSPANRISGAGGNSLLGGGGAGVYNVASETDVNGNAGGNYGGGGSGCSEANTGSCTGGAGALGVVIIEY